MLKSLNLYDQNPEAWARIERDAPACAEMARHFTDVRAMEIALHYTSGSVRNWIIGANRIAATSNQRAREWLNSRASDDMKKPAAKPALEAGEMLLVSCPASIAQKATRVLELLGCEVTTI